MPKFGVSRFLTPAASVDNPQRYGIYVRTVRRTGRLNPGKHYELTDGKGNFWLAYADNVEEIQDATTDAVEGGE